MELSDLLDTHTVVFTCLSTGVSESNTIVTSSDLVNIIETSSARKTVIQVPFSFKNDIQAPAAVTSLINLTMNFSSNISVDGGSSTAWYNVSLRIYQLQSVENHVRVKVWSGGGDTFEYCTATPYLDINKTYALTLYIQWVTSSSFIVNAGIESYEDGRLTPVDGTDTSQGITGDLTDVITLNLDYYSNVKFDGFIYEFDAYTHDASVVNAGLSKIHRIFGAIDRILECTYTEVDFTRIYLFPPAPVYNGSAYDNSLVLENEISELDEQLVDLTADLVVAQADLTALQTKITTGFIENVNECFITITSWITGIDGEILKIASAYGSEGKFSLATLNAALTDIINAGFDAIEDAM